MSFKTQITNDPNYRTIESCSAAFITADTPHNILDYRQAGFHNLNGTLYQIAIKIIPNSLIHISFSSTNQYQQAAQLCAFKSEDNGVTWNLVALGPTLRTFHTLLNTDVIGAFDNFHTNPIVSLIVGNAIQIFYTSPTVSLTDNVGVLARVNFDGTSFSSVIESNFSPFPITQASLGWFINDEAALEFGYDENNTKWFDWSVGRFYSKKYGDTSTNIHYFATASSTTTSSALTQLIATKLNDNRVFIVFSWKFTPTLIHVFENHTTHSSNLYYTIFDGSTFSAPAIISHLSLSTANFLEVRSLSYSAASNLINLFISDSIANNYKFLQFNGSDYTLNAVQTFGAYSSFGRAINFYQSEGFQYILTREQVLAQFRQLYNFDLNSVIPLTLNLTTPVPPPTFPSAAANFIRFHGSGYIADLGDCFVCFAYATPIGTGADFNVRIYVSQYSPTVGWTPWSTSNILNLTLWTNTGQNFPAVSGTWFAYNSQAVSTCQMGTIAPLNDFTTLGIMFVSMDITPHQTCGGSLNFSDRLIMGDFAQVVLGFVDQPPPPVPVEVCPDIVASSACAEVKTISDDEPILTNCDETVFSESAAICPP